MNNSRHSKEMICCSRYEINCWNIEQLHTKHLNYDTDVKNSGSVNERNERESIFFGVTESYASKSF